MDLSIDPFNDSAIDFEEINGEDVRIAEEESKIAEKSTSLAINTNISASVYIDSQYMGTTPFSIRGLSSGTHRIVLARRGYYSRSFDVYLRESVHRSVYIDLHPVTGYISVTTEPDDAEVYIDGQRIYRMLNEVTEGIHQVVVRRFGYKEYKKSVQVLRRQTRSVSVSLDRAPFEVSELSLSRNDFNPSNPGNLGKTRINFTVAAPGSGEISIFDTNGVPVRSIALSNFRTWVQEVYWDGRSNSGTILPDGTYTITLTAHGSIKPDTVLKKDIMVYLDSTITYRFLSVSAAGGSTGRVPSAYIFPEGTLFTSFTAGPFFAPMDQGFISVPLKFSFIGTPAQWLELGLSTAVYINGNTVPVAVGMHLKAGGRTGDFSFAGILRYRFLTERVIMEEAGLSAGAAAEWHKGSFTAGLSSEIIFGAEQGILVPFSAVWSSGTSVRYRFNNMEFGAWLKVTSAGFETHFNFYDILYGGLEYDFIIPGTDIILNFQTAAGTGRNTPFVISASAGFGILF